MTMRTMVFYSMANRDFIFNIIPKHGIGAEIGVWRGEFAQRLLNDLEPIRLILVDPWIWDQGDIPRDCYIATTRFAKNQHDMDVLHNGVRERFQDYSEVRIYRKKSVDAAPLFSDQFFDWVYIDGSHDYESVKADLAAWAPKIKVGGFLMGDDYDWGAKKYQKPVERAVKEMLKNNTTFVAHKIKNGQFVLRREQ